MTDEKTDVVRLLEYHTHPLNESEDGWIIHAKAGLNLDHEDNWLGVKFFAMIGSQEHSGKFILVYSPPMVFSGGPIFLETGNFDDEGEPVLTHLFDQDEIDLRIEEVAVIMYHGIKAQQSIRDAFRERSSTDHTDDPQYGEAEQAAGDPTPLPGFMEGFNFDSFNE